VVADDVSFPTRIVEESDVLPSRLLGEGADESLNGRDVLVLLSGSSRSPLICSNSISPDEASWRPSTSDSISSISSCESSERSLDSTVLSSFFWLQPPGALTFAFMAMPLSVNLRKRPSPGASAAETVALTCLLSTPSEVATASATKSSVSSFVSPSTLANSMVVTTSLTFHSSNSHVCFLGPQPSAMACGADGQVLPSGQH